MPIRIQRTGLGQDPRGGRVQVPTRIETVQIAENPAATFLRPAEQAAHLAEQLYREDRDREIENRVRELDIARRQADNEIVNEYQQALGKNAVEARGRAMAAIRANSRRVREGVTDRAVLDVWKGRDAALTEANIGQIDTHFREQNVRWQDETMHERSALLQDSTRRTALGDGYDPGSGALSIDAQRNRSAYHAEIDARGKLRGWDAATVANVKQAADSQALGGIVEDLVQQGRVGEAETFLKAHGAAIDADTGRELGGLVRRGQEIQVRDQADDQAGRLVLQLMNPQRQQDPQGAAPKSWAEEFQLQERQRLQRTIATRAEINRRFLSTGDDHISDDVRQKALARLKEEEAAHADDVKSAREQTTVEAERWLSENRYAPVERLPADLAMRVDAYGIRDNINSFAKDRQYATDQDYRAELAQQPESFWRDLDPKEFEFGEARGRLNPTDMQWALGRIAGAQHRANGDQQRQSQVNRAIDAALYDMDLLNRVTGKPVNASAVDIFRYEAQHLLENPPTGETPKSWTIEKVLKQMSEARMRDKSNYFTKTASERQASQVDVDGRAVPIADIVDENGQPMVQQIIEDIRADNIERARRGQPLQPETIEGAAAVWAARIARIQPQRESALLADMKAQGMSPYSTGLFGDFARSNALVTTADAEKLTGLTAAEIVERIGGENVHTSPFQFGPAGFRTDAMARLYDKVRRERMRKTESRR